MRYIDLFAGIGGFHYGLEKAGGFNCVWASEWNKYAAQIYAKQYPKTPLETSDIRTIDVKRIPEHELLCAGFPCQAFSVAGKRKGFNDTRGTLFFEIAKILEAKKPPLVMLENVKGLLSHERGRTFGTIIQTLGKLGYWVEWQVLNSKHFGVPQNRERVFIIGHLRGKSTSQIFPIWENETIHSKKNASQSTYLKSPLRGQGDKAIIELGCAMRGRGEGWKHELEFRKDNVANQLTTVQKDSLVFSKDIRRLTPMECERLQGFPDGWTKGISDTQRYKCLGNAVTTNVITAIGHKIRKAHREEALAV